MPYQLRLTFPKDDLILLIGRTTRVETSCTALSICLDNFRRNHRLDNFPLYVRQI
jgi:hypothetical protein